MCDCARRYRNDRCYCQRYKHRPLVRSRDLYTMQWTAGLLGVLLAGPLALWPYGLWRNAGGIAVSAVWTIGLACCGIWIWKRARG